MLGYYYCYCSAVCLREKKTRNLPNSPRVPEPRIARSHGGCWTGTCMWYFTVLAASLCSLPPKKHTPTKPKTHTKKEEERNENASWTFMRSFLLRSFSGSWYGATVPYGYVYLAYLCASVRVYPRAMVLCRLLLVMVELPLLRLLLMVPPLMILLYVCRRCYWLCCWCVVLCLLSLSGCFDNCFWCLYINIYIISMRASVWNCRLAPSSQPTPPY